MNSFSNYELSKNKTIEHNWNNPNVNCFENLCKIIDNIDVYYSIKCCDYLPNNQAYLNAETKTINVPKNIYEEFCKRNMQDMVIKYEDLKKCLKDYTNRSKE